MFQFSGFPPYTYVFSIRSYTVNVWGFPIRTSTDQSLFAAPRGFSQLIASFFGYWCQGIHLMLFLAWTTCAKQSFAVDNWQLTIIVEKLRFSSFILNLQCPNFNHLTLLRFVRSLVFYCVSLIFIVFPIFIVVKFYLITLKKEMVLQPLLLERLFLLHNGWIGCAALNSI